MVFCDARLFSSKTWITIRFKRRNTFFLFDPILTFFRSKHVAANFFLMLNSRCENNFNTFCFLFIHFNQRKFLFLHRQHVFLGKIGSINFFNIGALALFQLNYDGKMRDISTMKLVSITHLCTDFTRGFDRKQIFHFNNRLDVYKLRCLSPAKTQLRIYWISCISFL